MISIIGIITTFVLLFGSYTLSGGKFGILLHALPFEGGMILGAGCGAFLVSNNGHVAKKTLKYLSKVFKPTKWKKQDYIDVLLLLFEIIKTMRTKGMAELEGHIENPHESEIFKHYPRILEDHFAVDFICDTLRLVSMNMENPYQVEDMMNEAIEKHHHEATHPAHAVQTMADGLPAIGIVAAVLGVIKTMASITEPPAVLGALIGGALVGTFLGVFFAYCFVGPFANKMKEVAEEEGAIYQVIKKVIVTNLHGAAPQVAVEVGRIAVPSHLQPTFKEIEESQQNVGK
ncbi:MAG: flagellar motor stator protein MotA [Sphingobacteriia bacterium]|nr:flagellar motor stator protein MotA [Sphingobacteriia bacterium]